MAKSQARYLALETMKKVAPPKSVEEYVGSLGDWQRPLVEQLRALVLKSAPAPFEEVIKWGHLVYLSNGPVLLIRAEDRRVLFGFWRGQRLRSIVPGLKPGGKYEMATLELHAGESVSPKVVRRLVSEAAALNASLGDPTKLVK